MSTLYLIRHGQASFGTDDYDRLSHTGREQVRILGEHLAQSEARIDRIYCGTLNRQRETAELLATAVNVAAGELVVEPAFNEYDSDAILKCYAATLTPAQLEAAGWPALRADRRVFQFFLERAAGAWVDGRIESASLTPWRDFHGSIIQALHALIRNEGRSRTLALSTSGGVIGVIVAHVLGLPGHRAVELNWALHNASITRLYYNAEKATLSMFNALPHLDREGRRELITYR